VDKDARFKSFQVNQSLFEPVYEFNDVEAIYNDVDESEVPVDVEPGVRVLTRFLTCQYTGNSVLMVHSSEVTP